MISEHVQSPNRNNSQKNLHTFGGERLLPAEQKGCHPGSKGCKDQLMLSKAVYVCENCRRRNRNLSIAWIDYQKAFDSVPHSWVEKSIELLGVNSKIVRFCKPSLDKWNTRLLLKTKQEVMQSQPIQIRRGIFQKDCLSPLLFCIILIPLTDELNRLPVDITYMQLIGK